nr:cilia- and flagella-associated protein 157-like [Nerophis lumbriciformis]
MPKKKEKKNGDGQDEDKKKTKKNQSQPLPVEENDKEKDLYLIQIRFLSEQLERYQLKCKEVTNEKKALMSQCSFLEKEKEDIVDFLKRSLLEKEDELDDTSERLRALRREADQGMDALRLQLARERQEVVERSDELAEQNVKLVARLTAVEEFERQKEQTMSKMVSLEKQLTNQEEAHAAAVHAVEMKALLEKRRWPPQLTSPFPRLDRLVSQMEVQAVDLERMAESKLPETTRRTLRENQRVKVRYGVLSERAHDLAQENAALRDQKTKLAADVDVLEETIREMSRQTCVRKKVAEQLTSKCQQLQTQLKESSHDLEQLGSKHEKVRGQLEEVRDSHTIAIKQSSKNRALAARLEAELQQERERRSKMQEAVAAVRHVVMEAHQNPEAVRWNQLMRKLLVILEGHAPSMSDASKLTSDRR